eukprot:sb/3470061/
MTSRACSRTRRRHLPLIMITLGRLDSLNCYQGERSSAQALQRGFYEMVPMHLLTAFDEKDLELIVCGLGSIDVDDWRNNTKLKGCTENSDVVKWFWQVVEEMDNERKARLLQFATGSSRVPINGFAGLRGSSTVNSAPRLFTLNVTNTMSNRSLPKAQTCFNRLDLPHYESFEIMRGKIKIAIEETRHTQRPTSTILFLAETDRIRNYWSLIG